MTERLNNNKELNKELHKVCVCVCARVRTHAHSHSVVSDSATLWTIACQAPLSMGFSRQEYWSGLPFPPPGDLSDPGIEPMFPELQDSFTTEPPGKPRATL